VFQIFSQQSKRRDKTKKKDFFVFIIICLLLICASIRKISQCPLAEIFLVFQNKIKNKII